MTDWAIALFWFAAFAFWIGTVVLAYFVIWSRRDWEQVWRIVATVLLTIVFAIPFVGPTVYAVVDVATRKAVSGGAKALWIVAAILLGPIGTTICFIWALYNKPAAPDPPPSMATH